MKAGARMDLDERKRIGARLRAARDAKDWSQDELAARARCSKPTISRLEAGERGGSRGVWQSLARALGVSLSDLLDESAQGASLGDHVSASEVVPAVGEVFHLLATRFGSLPPTGQRRVLRVIRAILE